VIAIENVRLFNETKEALERQTATSDILRTISSSPTDIQPVFDAIVESGMRLVDGDQCVLLGRQDGIATFLASHHNSPEAKAALLAILPRPVNRETTAGRAILDRCTVQIPDVLADPDYGLKHLTTVLGYRATIAVPMMREGDAIGAMTVSRKAPGEFSPRQIEILKTFADQAVIAIENVRLFEELESRNRDLTRALDRQTATAEVLRVISQSQTELQPVFDAIVEHAMRLFQAWAASLLRSDGQLVHLVAMRGGLPGSDQQVREQSPWSIHTSSPVTRCLASKTVVQVADVETDPALDEGIRELGRARGWRSILAAPMMRDGQPIGAIAVQREEARPFSAAEIELLRTFADQAVIAIENARLLGELRARTSELTRSVDQLTALGEVGQAVSSSLDLETVLTTIVSRAVQLSGLDGGTVFEYDETAEEFVQRATTGTARVLAGRAIVPKGEGVVGQTAVTFEPVEVPDIQVGGAYESRLREALLAAGVRAIIAVPIIREGRLLGGFAVNRNTPGEFPAETIELLRTFATQSALAIQNARLFHEIEGNSRQLEAASRHKSEFLANMSHELRTPLNAIIGFSEVVIQRMFGELNEKQDEYLKDIYASGQHLLSLINDILDLSKIEAGRMELEVADFDLPSAIDNALILVRERATRRGITLGHFVDERLGTIRGDERKVKQVLLNLLSNALKFTPEGGRIDVRATMNEYRAEISVTDTGVGIAPEDQKVIFEEFRQVGTADKKVEGTGLGLALSRKFIELHGGRIWVKSREGEGSTFTFTLPVDRRE
jgi:signal transduction histidine kinase